MPTSPWKLPAMMALAIALSPLCTAAAQQAPVVEYRCYVADQRLPEAEGHVRHIHYSMAPRPTAEDLLYGKACLYFPYSLTGKDEQGTSVGTLYHYYSDDTCCGDDRGFGWSGGYNNLQSLWSLFTAKVPQLSEMTADKSLYLKYLWDPSYNPPPRKAPDYWRISSVDGENEPWEIEPYNMWSCLQAHKKNPINETLPKLEGDIWVFRGRGACLWAGKVNLSAEEAVEAEPYFSALQQKEGCQHLRYLKRSRAYGGKTGVYPIFDPEAEEDVLKKRLDIKLRTAVLFTALCDHFSQSGSLPVIMKFGASQLVMGVRLHKNKPEYLMVTPWTSPQLTYKDKDARWAPAKVTHHDARWAPAEELSDLGSQMTLFPYLPSTEQDRAYKPITPHSLADYEKIANRIWPDRRASTRMQFLSPGNFLLLAVVVLALYWGVNKYRSYTANKGREGSQLYTRKGSRGA